jgi:uncharacterized membrane protein
MAEFTHSIDVNVPLSTAYNQWTQFEDFPYFMEGVEAVHQLDDRRMHWKAEIGGVDKEWDAEIVEQIPDQRVAWTSTTGARNAGAVDFHYIDPNKTRVTLTMDYEPEGVVENIGSALGLVESRMAKDLERFKQFIESRGVETGAWRGNV